MMQVGISKPFIGEEEKRAVLEVLDSGQLVQGRWVQELEARFADLHGAKHGVATSNGTTALTAALIAHGIGPGDEVIIPSFSFFATASSVLSVNARPVFADIEPETFTLSVDAAEAAVTPRTKAVMPVHLYGHLADMPRLGAWAEQRGLVMLEDAAQAHLASIGSQRAGAWGTASFSFYPSKNMTTAEGGMVLTNDDAVAERLRMVRNHGMSQQYKHELLGFNLRMTNLAAAIGLQQLPRLEQWTRQRIDNAAFLSAHLPEGLRAPIVRPECMHVFHQYTVRVEPGRDRDAVLKALQDRGVGARVYYPTPIHRQPIFAEDPAYAGLELPETERACREVMSLPVHPLLTDDERQYIVEKVQESC